MPVSTAQNPNIEPWKRTVGLVLAEQNSKMNQISLHSSPYLVSLYTSSVLLFEFWRKSSSTSVALFHSDVGYVSDLEEEELLGRYGAVRMTTKENGSILKILHTVIL